LKQIKKIAIEIILSIVAITIISSAISYIRKPDINDKTLSTLIAKDIEGKSVDIREYSGKPILIHFWATWCPTCKIELANIERVSKKYQVITIAVKSGSNDDILSFMREHESNFTVINDKSGEISSRFDIGAFPTTIIYDSRGKLSFSEVGYTTTAGLLARMLWLEAN